MVERLRKRVGEYIARTSRTVDFHQNNMHSSAVIGNVFSLSSIIISSVNALLLTILTVIKSDDIIITLVCSVLSFIQIIITKIKDDFNFSELKLLHENAYDDFCEILTDFNNLNNRIDDLIDGDQESCNQAQLKNDFYILVAKFDLLVQKNHVMSVYACFNRFFCCCK